MEEEIEIGKKITERGLKIMSFMMPHTLRVCRVFRLS